MPCDAIQLIPARRQWLRAVLGAFLCLFTSLAPFEARAEVLLDGSAEAVRLETNDAPIGEVLVSLAATFGVRYSASIDLGQRVTGKFSGPLDRVVAQLLTRYNYIVKVTSASVEIALLQEPGATPIISSAHTIPRQPASRTSIGRQRP